MKKLMMLLIVVCCFIYNQFVVYAVTEIPEPFEAEVLIRYTSKDNYIILKGRNKVKYQYNEDDYIAISGETITINDSQGTMYIENYPVPFKDMFVQYGSDGCINKIYTFKDNDILNEENTSSSYEQVSTWGTNYLYINVDNNKYHHYGTGNATVFKNNINQRGDVSIQISYDNCAYNSSVKLSLPKKDKYLKNCYMKKRNSINLTNSLITIWKRGVEYWGYEYEDSLNINDMSAWYN